MMLADDWDFHVSGLERNDCSLFNVCMDSVVGDNYEREDPDVPVGELLDALYSLNKKSKRVRDRRRLLVPRLVQMDIRRHYLQMFTNTMNSHDPIFLSRFAHRYLAPNIVLTKPKQASNIVNYYPSKDDSIAESTNSLLHFSGISDLVSYWTALMELTPDNITKVDNIRIVRRTRRRRTAKRVATTMSSSSSSSSTSSMSPNDDDDDNDDEDEDDPCEDSGACRIECDFYVKGTRIYRDAISRVAGNAIVMCYGWKEDNIDELAVGSIHHQVEDLSEISSVEEIDSDEPLRKRVKVTPSSSDDTGTLNNLLNDPSIISTDKNTFIPSKYTYECRSDYDRAEIQRYRSVACGPVYLRMLPKPIPMQLHLTLVIEVNKLHQIASFKFSVPSGSVLSSNK